MKSINTVFICVIILSLTLSSCAVSDISISVQKPSELILPSDVNRILVLNNTTMQNKEKTSIMESILTGEQLQGDKVASENCIQGLVNTLNESNRYQAVAVSDQSIYNIDNSIDWKLLNDVCIEQGSELMIVMNLFDTDAQMGGMITGVATGGTPVYGEAVFDIYYPKEELIIHNMKIADGIYVQSNVGIDPLLILDDMARKRGSTNELAYKVGSTAAWTMVPYWIWVDRKYYKRGSKGLKNASRLIRNGNWDLAEKKLDLILSSAEKQKELERATFNMALVKEGKGNLTSAVEYAEKAALEFDNKIAPEYLNQLKQRLEDQLQLDYQLERMEN